MKGKLIVIEGTDCSGKQTQGELLKLKLSKLTTIQEMSFPMYNTPTGNIIGGSYLGKPHIGPSVFPEGAAEVSGKVAGLYFAADRLYNISKVNECLEKGHLLLDRYIDSNMAHQAGKLTDKNERNKTYKFFEKLEYCLLKLPKADIKILLFMPVEYSAELKKHRAELPDGHESNAQHLLNAQNAYLEIAKRNHYKVINCVKNDKIRTIEDINEELFAYVAKKLKLVK